MCHFCNSVTLIMGNACKCQNKKIHQPGPSLEKMKKIDNVKYDGTMTSETLYLFAAEYYTFYMMHKMSLICDKISVKNLFVLLLCPNKHPCIEINLVRISSLLNVMQIMAVSSNCVSLMKSNTFDEWADFIQTKMAINKEQIMLNH